MIEFRLTDFLYPKNLLYWRWKLWRSQYYSLEQQQELQWGLLSGLLDHCFTKVPYYRELSTRTGLTRQDIHSLEDFSRIPVLSKDVLFDNPHAFRADNFARYNPRGITTSGTTGTPLTVYWDADSNVLELTAMWRHFSWAGYRLGEPFLDIRSVLFDDPGGYKWNWKCRGLEMSSDSISKENIRAFAAIIRRYGIRLWRGHPSSMDRLCRLLDDAGIQDIRPRYIFTNSEALLEHQRSFIESWSGIPVCDNYGLKEHNALICQCSQGGYHIATEYGLVEIIREDDSPVNPGEEGRVIATSLHNRAYPLLRYDTGDYATRSERACSCGRTLPLVDSLTGRIDDRVLTAEGEWVSGLHFAFFMIDGVRKAQLVQREPGALEVHLVPSAGYSSATGENIRDNLRRKLGSDMQVKIHTGDGVPHESRGKFKFVVSHLEPGKRNKSC